ncbi:MAG: hypothetical protein M0Z98_09655 [Actinomycetales bacterium]|nr:hypothetical protein [Actinomycetales bacterium]
MSILLDAGPILNFVAVSEQGLLLGLAEAHDLSLAAPEKVREEVDRKAATGRFARTGALSTWRKLVAAGRVGILDDTLTDEFVAAVVRVSGQQATDRVRSSKDLGELMVIAHASVLSQQGTDVFVLIDEGDGRKRALREKEWLATAGAAGTLTLWNTPQVLKQTAPERWKSIYTRMRDFDDGLAPLC